jgi:hypothetical protein
VLKEIVKAYPAGTISVHVVWMPMVPGDDAAAARQTASMFAGLGVHQYYDERKIVGLSYHRDVFPNCLQEALRGTPRDHPIYEQLKEWAKSPKEGPVWDAVLFYPSGIEWKDRVPTPKRWSKQIDFMGAGTGDVTGVFYRNDCGQPPTDSDWHRELRQAMNALSP